MNPLKRNQVQDIDLVDNTSDANKPISTATQTALNLKVDKTITVNGQALSTNVTLTKSDVGLANVDNTSDVNKPVSTAQATANTNVQNFSIARANHTGTQIASTISDFASSVAALITGKANLTGGNTFTGIQTMTSPAITTPTGIVKGDVGLSLADNTSDATKNSAIATLNNKRITKRVLALSANSATPAVNTDNFDVVNITAQTATITSFTMTGTPVDGDTLRISITGTAAVSFTLGGSFEASTLALGTTTTGTARLDMGFMWNSASSKWRQVAQA